MKMLGICELKKLLFVVLLFAGLMASSSVNASYYQEVRPENYRVQEGVPIPASGTVNRSILAKAPSPDIVIQGIRRKAIIVVDLSNNILYKYDRKGNAQIAYLVASGKQSTPTAEGVRIVSHVETYPYRSAPANTKRHKVPYAFGPKVIILNMVDTYRGIKWNNGEYIHGNNDPSSIGKFASHGCIRMDNSVITELSKSVSHGDIVVMRR